MAAKKNWIAGVVGKNPGGLHKSLGVPAGKTIPKAKIAKATHSANPITRKQATLAQTLEKMHGSK